MNIMGFFGDMSRRTHVRGPGSIMGPVEASVPTAVYHRGLRNIFLYLERGGEAGRGPRHLVWARTETGLCFDGAQACVRGPGVY